MGPLVVSASKSGAVLPNLNFFCSNPSTALPILIFFAGGDEILSLFLIYLFVRLYYRTSGTGLLEIGYGGDNK
jgi:hypothetical protein